MKKLSKKKYQQFKNQEQETKSILLELLEKHDVSSIFSCMLDVLNPKERKELKGECSYFMQSEGFIMVKIETLNQEIQFEEAIKNILPHYNDQQKQLFI